MTRLERPLLSLMALALLVALPVSAQQDGAAAAISGQDPAATITEESVFNHLYFLASDGLRGRDTPSAGLEAAAAYLVSQHRGFGLEPAGENGTFYQHWPFRQIASDLDAASVTLTGSGGAVALAPGDNAAMRGSYDGEFDGGLVYVGTPAGPADGGSLEGRVAVFELGGELTPQQWRQRANQLRNWAGSAGATASVVVLDESMEGEALQQLDFLGAPTWVQGDDLPIPQVFVTRTTALRAVPELEALLGNAGGAAEAVAGARLHGTLAPDIRVDGNPANVAAMIRGSDPQLRDEYVVLSAHYDHVGVGQPDEQGDSIFNGADDNGSGTTALLETARAIAAMPTAPRRSILFVHVSGEEKGLLGSSWFADHSTVPVEQIVANINADMVGGDAHPDTLVVIGKTYSTLGPLVDRVNDGLPELGITTSDDLWPDQRFFFRSDQFHFMRKEIPSLFFFAGVHECYHRPCDEVSFVSHDKIARVARLLTHATLEIANQDARPEWDPAGLQEVRELVAGGR